MNDIDFNTFGLALAAGTDDNRPSHREIVSEWHIADRDTALLFTRGEATEGRHCAGGDVCGHQHRAALPAAPIHAPVPVPLSVVPAQRGRRSDPTRSLFGPIQTGLVKAILANRPSLTLIPGNAS